MVPIYYIFAILFKSQCQCIQKRIHPPRHRMEYPRRRNGRESVCVRCAMNIHNASDSGGGSLRDLLGRNIGRRAALVPPLLVALLWHSFLD